MEARLSEKGAKDGPVFPDRYRKSRCLVLRKRKLPASAERMYHLAWRGASKLSLSAAKRSRFPFASNIQQSLNQRIILIQERKSLRIRDLLTRQRPVAEFLLNVGSISETPHYSIGGGLELRL